MEEIELPNVTLREYEMLIMVLTERMEKNETPQYERREANFLLDKFREERRVVAQSPAEDHRLGNAEPAQVPDDAERTEDGEAAFEDDEEEPEGLGELFG